MQHDTSPHTVEVGGKNYQAQTASAVLAYSRLLFFQINPRFQRFDCKVFLSDALRYMGGVVERVMIDNTHVVVLRGTGREMIPVPEMEAFAERFGFHFVAHERGDANRSARVERPFWFIERNFLVGRKFSSWEDLNQQARQWCDRVNSTYKKHIRAVPRELYADSLGRPSWTLIMMTGRMSSPIRSSRGRRAAAGGKGIRLFCEEK
jgi:transposase